jgi:signal transduction histidine kinase
MTIKWKLYLGIGILFLTIVFLGGLGAYITKQSQNASENVLKDNYESLEYVQHMLAALDDHNAVAFAQSLQAQRGNVTEPGELLLTQRLQLHAADTTLKDSTRDHQLRSDLYAIWALNKNAIRQKHNSAGQSGERYFQVILGITCVVTLLGLTFLLNFPGYIANPIQTLTQSIKHIADRHYDTRLHFNSSDEFGELARAFNVMAEKLNEFEGSSIQKLLVEKKRITTLIETISDPVIGLDEKGQLLFLNQAASQALNIDAADLGKPNLLPRHNDLLQSLQQQLLQHPTEKKQFKIFFDNKETYFQQENIPIGIASTGDNQPQHMGWFIWLRNITLFKEQDLAKTHFIATISHELKTPIAALQMCGQLLRSPKVGPLNEEQQALVKTLDQETGRLLNITKELLDLAQVESGKIDLHVARVPAEEIVRFAIDTLRFTAQQKRVELDADIPANLPLLMADADKTTWVLTNLINNAIRYAPEGSTVKISAAVQGALATIAVQDHGAGIAPEMQQRIFDRYFSGSQQKGGTGLGLAIAKEFIEAQQGRITLESEPGKGTTFTIWLPVAMEKV